MYFLHAINSDRQTRLLNVLGQIAMILGGKKTVLIIITLAKHDNKLPDDGLLNRNMHEHFKVNFNVSFNISRTI